MKTLLLLLLLCLYGSVMCQVFNVTTVLSSDVNNDGYTDLLFSGNRIEYTNKGLKTTMTTSALRSRMFCGGAEGLKEQDSSLYDSTVADLFTRKKADVNNDGFEDLVYITETGITVRYGSKNGFSSMVNAGNFKAPPARKDWSVFFFDYDGDGYTDMLVSSNGHFSTWTATESSNFKLEILKGSANGLNGELTELGAYKNKEINVITNNDFNGDGKKDIFLSYNTFKGGYGTEVWLAGHNQETALKYWENWDTHFMGTDMYTFHAIGDMNGDGKKDIGLLYTATEKDIRKSNATPCTFLLFAGTPAGLPAQPMFSLPLLIPTQPNNRYLALKPLGDLDGDGFADVLIENQVPGTGISQGMGIIVWGAADSVHMQTSSFNDILQFAAGNKLHTVPTGDINGDKMKDLILYNEDSLFVIYGNRERKFIPVQVPLDK